MANGSGHAGPRPALVACKRATAVCAAAGPAVPNVSPRRVRSTRAVLPGHLVQERRIASRAARISRRSAARNALYRPRPGSAVAVPRDDGGRHVTVEGQALGNDVRRVVGAVLERGSREQPAREFPVVGLQVQRHIRGHLELTADQVGRPGLCMFRGIPSRTNPPPAAFAATIASRTMSRTTGRG